MQRVGNLSITASDNLCPAISYNGVVQEVCITQMAKRTRMICLNCSARIKPSWSVSKYLKACRRRSPCKPFISCVNSLSVEIGR